MPMRMQQTKNSKQLLLRGFRTGLLLGESPLFADVVTEIASCHKVHYKIEVVTILEGVQHVYEEP